jgi:predicted DNA-binding antitoxin AbrB/MazE fold protein
MVKTGAVMTIKAVYERGVFRPTEPLNLAEGTAVEIEVPMAFSDPAARLSPAEVARRLEEIAALPIEPDAQPTSSEDIDQVLYGGDRPR